VTTGRRSFVLPPCPPLFRWHPKASFLTVAHFRGTSSGASGVLPEYFLRATRSSLRRNLDQLAARVSRRRDAANLPHRWIRGTSLFGDFFIRNRARFMPL
jgi:hypothetical protein